MKRRHARVLAAVFSHPTSGSIGWKDVEALFIELGAEIQRAAGIPRGRTALRRDRRVFHRPHPGPDTDKGAVAGIREWPRANGVEP